MRTRAGLQDWRSITAATGIRNRPRNLRRSQAVDHQVVLSLQATSEDAMKTPRNPVARSALLSKGGRHQKPRSAERNRARRELRREVRQTNHRGQDAPGSVLWMRDGQSTASASPDGR